MSGGTDSFTHPPENKPRGVSYISGSQMPNSNFLGEDTRICSCVFHKHPRCTDAYIDLEARLSIEKLADNDITRNGQLNIRIWSPGKGRKNTQVAEVNFKKKFRREQDIPERKIPRQGKTGPESKKALS